ncbi:mannose-1-phosphate guanylyltransferase/mannose-6-phosphate isomerase [Shewanella sp. JM162201]|uniref:mannose-1-phosphate guanylyltransferase n=1 Tax=Shewanella jiangmenensis TaxID=2837387 RepID=A0ABS5V3R8_9GAMM|nr:mannose-1-phosphate guanylyltransferase/mannose-6-phosphate isomerase [Shewanella jiangmenensis]MBT1445092.1 mannose-1-phosphate guanylyltransferase/mannose-6-phosphate isomerase [Shewanella jiangmenensis]
MIPLILSGGTGTRLWPLSRKLFPKQFHALTGEHSLLQQTMLRLGSVELQAPIVVCNSEHHFIASEQLAQVHHAPQLMVLEPFGRNTAPAVALVAMHLLAQGRDEMLLVLPADHLIKDENAFAAAVAEAGKVAESGQLALFGIRATHPETGYGYIRGESVGLLGQAQPVAEFIEKPNSQLAAQFVEQGNYFWNSGMFMFRCSDFIEELGKYSPAILQACNDTLAASKHKSRVLNIDADAFRHCPDDSIDYAVMEHTAKAVVVPFAGGWTDVGSWSALREVQAQDENRNACRGDVLLKDCNNSYIHATNRLVTVLGMSNVVVVETKDAVMIAHADRSQDIKTVVNTLGASGRDEVNSHPQVFRPWGSYDSVDQGRRFQVKRITVQPGARLSLQKHHHRAEHWIVVSGTAEVTCDDKVFLLTENQSTYIPIASVHRLANPGKIPLEIIEVQSGSYLGEDDIERYDDIYGRAPGLEQRQEM